MKRKLGVLGATLLLAAILFMVKASQENTPVRFIELNGTITSQNASISALAWFNDTLLILPEKPQIFASDGNNGVIFGLLKTDILAYLAGSEPAPLTPFSIPVHAPELLRTFQNQNIVFEGFEALVVKDSSLYLTIESHDRVSGAMRHFLVRGTLDADVQAVNLDVNLTIEIPTQSRFDNLG